MKKTFILFVWICIALTLQSQNLPQGIAYQAVAIKEGERAIAGQNPTQLYWANKDIQVRFTVFEKYPGGMTQYSESHSLKTDDYGVFNAVIGQGTVISGDFTKIPWDLGTAHLQVEIDFDNNGTYKLTSLERFWSVPYAFVTRKNSSSSTDSALNALNNKFNYLKNRDKDTVIGNEGGVSYKSLDSLNKVLIAKLAAIKTSDKDTVVGNEWQKLTRNNDTLVLSDGGGNVILRDEDPKNELQVLSRIKDTVLLSINGGRFVLNDDDPKNELQEFRAKGDTLTLSKGGGNVVLSSILANSSSASITNMSSAENTCFQGVVVDISTWGSFNNYDFVETWGTPAKNFFIFSAFNSNRTIGGLFLHNLNTNTITKIYNKIPYQSYVDDSMIYIVEDNSNYSVIVRKLNVASTTDSITKFNPNSGFTKFDRPIITKKGDLIWIGSNSGLQGLIYKFDCKNKTLSSITNPQNGYNYGKVQIISGDTILLGTRIVNGNTMALIFDIDNLIKGSSDEFIVYNNQVLYYNYYGLRSYDLINGSDAIIGNGPIKEYGINNGLLWMKCQGNTYNTYGSGPQILTLNRYNVFTIKCSTTTSFNINPLTDNIYVDNKKRFMGPLYCNKTSSSLKCINGKIHRFKLGYFYSEQ